LNGNLDSSYNFDKNTKEGLHGANGVISDAFMQADGKLILVGRFTRYNNTPVNNIVRLNIDGSIDETFVVGSAANDNIYTIRYNVNTKRYILTGSFNTFNGNPANKMVLLNEDGSVDQSFITGAFIEGVPTFAGQLNNGLILVAGSFSSYNNIIREGLMVLNPDGTLAVGYNNTGRFTGIVSDMVETTSGIGNLPSVILTGFIPRFEGNEVGNLLKLVFSK